MDAQTFKTPACCDRPNITTMDHNLSRGGITRNRMCLHCGQHWYGKDGHVRAYTRLQWDAWVNAGRIAVA